VPCSAWAQDSRQGRSCPARAQSRTPIRNLKGAQGSRSFYLDRLRGLARARCSRGRSCRSRNLGTVPKDASVRERKVQVW